MADPLADLARLEGVPSAVVSARDAVDAVLRDRGMRAVGPEQVSAALLQGARASAALSDDPERWLPGAVRLGTELLSLSASVRSAPAQVLARAHALLAYGTVEDRRLGRLRDEPPVPQRVAGLAALLTAPTEAPVLVLAAVAHAELAVVEPFGSADALVARAVEHMVLVAGGVDPRGVVVVEAGHLELQDGYRDALTAYRTGTADGLKQWLLHCAQALTRGAELSPVTRRG